MQTASGFAINRDTVQGGGLEATVVGETTGAGVVVVGVVVSSGAGIVVVTVVGIVVGIAVGIAVVVVEVAECGAAAEGDLVAAYTASPSAAAIAIVPINWTIVTPALE